MIGDSQSPGIIPSAFMQLFAQTGERPPPLLRVCFVEVYNEVVRDLLTSDQSVVEIQESPEGKQILTGANEVEIRTISEVMTVIK